MDDFKIELEQPTAGEWGVMFTPIYTNGNRWYVAASPEGEQRVFPHTAQEEDTPLLELVQKYWHKGGPVPDGFDYDTIKKMVSAEAYMAWVEDGLTGRDVVWVLDLPQGIKHYHFEVVLETDDMGMPTGESDCQEVGCDHEASS